MISFFANFAYIAKNTSELIKAKKLMDPEAPTGYRTVPLDPGVNIARRPFTWIGPIVIAVIFGVSAASSDSNGSSGGSNYVPSPSPPVTYGWVVGNCVSFGTTVYPVSCGSVHAGKIVATSTLSQDCPTSAEAFVNSGTRIYCIDEDL
jgi:hypothetical protein